MEKVWVFGKVQAAALSEAVEVLGEWGKAAVRWEAERTGGMVSGKVARGAQEELPKAGFFSASPARRGWPWEVEVEVVPALLEQGQEKAEPEVVGFWEEMAAAELLAAA